MSADTQTRKPRFLGATSDEVKTAAFRPLRDTLPPNPGVAKRIEPPKPVRPEPVEEPAPSAPPPPVVAAEPKPVAPPLPPPPDYAPLARAVEQLRAQSERLAAEARSDALEIGFQVARRILEMELASGPEPFFALIRSALKRAGEARSVKVRLSPEDIVRVESAGGPASITGFGVATVELVSDATLERGDCLVDTEFGSVDGRLETRLEELKRGVQSALEIATHEGEAA